jgi:uncharacterized membrane-anchored protein
METSQNDTRNEYSAYGKIPELTALFWLMKITATTLGETGGDLFSMTLKIGYLISVIIFLAFFITVVTTQLAVKSYIPIIYWLVIVATSTVGTTMSDYMDRTLELGYTTGTIILISILLLILFIWKITEKSLSVTNIKTRRAEVFYWTAILFSNTLGTALGDFLADDSGLGFIGAAELITAVLVVIVLAYYFTRINRVLLFWIAFVLTRPFGATFGDVLTKTPDRGGLGYGTQGSSAILLGMLIVMIIYETWKLRMKRVEVKENEFVEKNNEK